MKEFKEYKRTATAELRPYEPGEELMFVSISHADRKNGSPKLGDMIARNPDNHKDQWLVSENYFKANFEPAGNSFMSKLLDEARAHLAEARKALEPFAAVADLIDSETEGMAETDELELHFHDYLMASWPVSLFRAARRALGGKADG